MSERTLTESLIRDIPDFPKPGILFKDITPVLQSPQALQEAIDFFVETASEFQPEVIAGIESRGFLFGTPLALALGVGFVPIRKVGKLPHTTVAETYDLEYGSAVVEIHADAIKPGMRVMIVDDLLATGGTAQAASRLIERIGGNVVVLTFLVELAFLPGRSLLTKYPVRSFVSYA